MFLDIFADFRAGVVWFGRVGIGPLPLSVGLEGIRDERMSGKRKKKDNLCLLGCVVWIDLLGDGEQVLDVESPYFLTRQGEGWRGHGMIYRLTDCVEEETEMA